MAAEFPRVEFRGLDLGAWSYQSAMEKPEDLIGHAAPPLAQIITYIVSLPTVPIQTRYPPRNVRFEIADVTERLRFADASVDVVHARMACLRVRSCLSYKPFPLMTWGIRRRWSRAFCRKSRVSCVLVDCFSAPSGVSSPASTPNTRSLRTVMRTSPTQSLFIKQHRACAFSRLIPAHAPYSSIVSGAEIWCRALRRRSSVSSDRQPPSRSLYPSSGPYPFLPLTLPTLPPLLLLSVG
jgi:hypothetical protein